jgi:ribosomal protein L34E
MRKSPSERTRPQVGDVIEVETPGGLAYAQYTHEHRDPPRYGSLLRVLPGLYETRPAAFARLVEEEERFWVFFPVGAATRRQIVRIVANETVAEAKRPFPVFRARNAVGGPWWMWDGKREWRARPGDTWTPRALSEVWNDTLLIKRIATGWVPADSPLEDPAAVD